MSKFTVGVIIKLDVEILSEKPKIVAGIPAFNEERTIAKVVVRAQRHVDEVIVVDDGSSDDTMLISRRLGAIVVRHERNLGYGAAIRSCFKAAGDFRADILVTLDADGQHDLDEIPSIMMTHLEQWLGKAC